eukprot:gene23241-17625_t
MAWAAYQFSIINAIKLDDYTADEEKAALKGGRGGRREMALLRETHEAISRGAEAFLRAEYSICAIFVA